VSIERFSVVNRCSTAPVPPVLDDTV
jgi:hypothetical protein